MWTCTHLWDTSTQPFNSIDTWRWPEENLAKICVFNNIFNKQRCQECISRIPHLKFQVPAAVYIDLVYLRSSDIFGKLMPLSNLHWFHSRKKKERKKESNPNLFPLFHLPKFFEIRIPLRVNSLFFHGTFFFSKFS